MYLLAFKKSLGGEDHIFNGKMIKIYFMILNQGKWVYLRITASKRCAM